MRTLRWEWWGSGVPWGAAFERQVRLRDAVRFGHPGTLALLEHQPVVTVGRRAAAVEVGTLEAQGVAVVRTDRGGLATWHGPGQLVGYLIAPYRRWALSVPDLVCRLEGGVLDWLAAQGVDASRRPGLPGVWVGSHKVAAVGLNVDRGVSSHGFALNLTGSLAGFAHILPCGVRDGGVTTVQRLAGTSPAPREAAPSVGEAVLRRLDDACDVQ